MKANFLPALLVQTLNHLLILFLRQKNKVQFSELEYFSLLHIPG